MIIYFFKTTGERIDRVYRTIAFAAIILYVFWDYIIGDVTHIQYQRAKKCGRGH